MSFSVSQTHIVPSSDPETMITSPLTVLSIATAFTQSWWPVSGSPTSSPGDGVPDPYCAIFRCGDDYVASSCLTNRDSVDGTAVA